MLKLGIPNSVPDSIMTGGAIYLGPGAIVQFNSSNISFDVFNYNPPGAFNVFAITGSGGTSEFNDNDPQIYNRQEGKVDSPLGLIQINGNDVTFTQPIYVSNIDFTTPLAATATFANTSVW